MGSDPISWQKGPKLRQIPFTRSDPSAMFRPPMNAKTIKAIAKTKPSGALGGCAR